MKIFNQTAEFPSKVNFIDENNVVLGYDLSQQCCERADWFILDQESDFKEYQTYEDIQKLPKNSSGLIEMQGWFFDTGYYKIIQPNMLDSGCMAIFRIIKQGWRVTKAEEKYIYLYNSQNGYYGHGFTFSIPSKEGTL